MHASGFEVREAHRDPSTPTLLSHHDTKANSFRICVLLRLNKRKGRYLPPPFSTIVFFWELSGNHLKDALQLLLQDALGNCPDDLLNRATVPED